MQVKTFIGTDNREVIEQIKAELGSEAIILESKTFQEDGRKLVRMTAALDRVEAISAPQRGASGEKAPTGEQWQREWETIQRHMLALLKPALRLDRLEARQRAAMEFLEREGANDQALLELYRHLTDRPGSSVLEPLSAMLPLKPWGLEHWPERTHLVAGPFGAGKTSTVVRLALALQKSRPGLRVCVVNADADRGSGRILLRHYAGLSDLHYREARSAAELTGVMTETREQDFEKIIIDLPGLSREIRLADLIRNLALNQAQPGGQALHLVFSPHYAFDTQQRFLEHYHLEMSGSLIWSKLDECAHYGAILNTSVASGLPISCFSFGPGLLNTLLPAEQAALWKLLFKRELPEAACGGA
ncbi:MAG: flagellar biosynthesis protein FlhF [Desulfovibrionaceae bacterium]|nr:flagellar biosynthesis protein FlhF [Desulfovibrionaceae bacterium]